VQGSANCGLWSADSHSAEVLRRIFERNKAQLGARQRNGRKSEAEAAVASHALFGLRAKQGVAPGLRFSQWQRFPSDATPNGSGQVCSKIRNLSGSNTVQIYNLCLSAQGKNSRAKATSRPGRAGMRGRSDWQIRFAGAIV
jgi:hypothetical protein